MKATGIEKVTILGAGTMGQEISLLAAICGYEVTLYDIFEESLRGAEARQQKHLKSMIASGYISQAEGEAAMRRIERTTDPGKAAAHADFVNESVPENIELKQSLYQQFAPLWPPQTVLTTNTSTLLPSMFAEYTGRPEKFAALHFHPHIWISNIADVMPHPDTLPETLDVVTEFAVSIRQVPIRMKQESPGYVFNAMLVPLLNAACSLAAEGVATYQDVDRAFMGIMRTKAGPFGIMDQIGLDTVHHVVSLQLKQKTTPRMERIATLLKTCIDEGHLGIKTGRGFYTYPTPEYLQPGFIEAPQQGVVSSG
jgi:3-hydroxybutyryl-CoA dehydrogenase